MAFIRIDKSKPGDPGTAPFIEESTIFTALRSTHFKPLRVPVRPPKIDGRVWTVFLDPVLSPDLRTVYFLVPAAGTSWFLMSAPITGGAARRITYVEEYCVLWGGKRPGDLLAAIRHMGSAQPLLDHWYYAWSRSSGLVKQGTQGEDGDFGQFAGVWGSRYGGTCQQNLR